MKHTEAALLTLAGTNVSEVHLTGYLVPEYLTENDYDSDAVQQHYFDDIVEKLEEEQKDDDTKGIEDDEETDEDQEIEHSE